MIEFKKIVIFLAASYQHPMSAFLWKAAILLTIANKQYQKCIQNLVSNNSDKFVHLKKRKM